MKNLLEERKSTEEKIFAAFGLPKLSYLEIDDRTGCQWHANGRRVTFSETLSDNDSIEYELELKRSYSHPFISTCRKFVAFNAKNNGEETLSIFDRSLECIVHTDIESPYEHKYKLKSECETE